jgi:peptide deformylase
MTVRPLRLLGDPVLRTPSDLVVRFDDAIAQLITDLVDTVQVPGRAGLAANQIGSSFAVFAYNVDGQLGYVINPVLAETSGEQTGEEGCLSIPGVSANRRRALRAVVTGVDLEQQPVTVAGDGELGRVLQHETDHLRGELYIDALTRHERAAILRALRDQSPAAPDNSTAVAHRRSKKTVDGP